MGIAISDEADFGKSGLLTSVVEQRKDALRHAAVGVAHELQLGDLLQAGALYVSLRSQDKNLRQDAPR